MKDKTCCFTGHRELSSNHSSDFEKRLENEIINLINKGVLYFAAGGAIGFDTLAEMTVLRLREVYPQIKLVLVLPCEGQTERWGKLDVIKYEWIRKQADYVKVLSPCYYNGCMMDRNRYLVDNSSFCICYQVKKAGGTAYTVNYAIKKGLKIIKV